MRKRFEYKGLLLLLLIAIITASKLVGCSVKKGEFEDLFIHPIDRGAPVEPKEPTIR